MQMSARILGKEYGLTGEEMNRVLLKHGFLKGYPNNYDLTEKAVDLARETDFHRGTGGYDYYNRYWTTRTFDDSIKEQLNVTPELIAEVRSELAEMRAARSAAQAVARAKADAEFLARQAADKAAKEAEERTIADAANFARNLKRAGIIGLAIGGGVAVGYGIYKAVPRLKARRHEREKEKHKKTQNCEEAAYSE